MDRGQMSREDQIQSLIDAGYTRDGAIYFLDNGDVDRNTQAASQYSPYALYQQGGGEVNNKNSMFGQAFSGFGSNPTVQDAGYPEGFSPNNMIIRDEMNPRLQNPDGAPTSVESSYGQEVQFDPKKGWAYEPEEGEGDPNTKQGLSGLGEIPLIYGGGTSSEYEAYSLGNFLGMDKGTKGRGLGIAGSAGALGLGLLRQGFSGFANQKQNERSKNWATDKMNERNYKNQSEYGDRNYTGGRFKMGGTITLKPKSKN